MPERTRQDWAAVVALVLLPVLVLGRGLLPGRVLSPADNLLALHPWNALAPGTTPANALLGDVTMMFHPWLLYAGAEVAHGRVPLWNPHSFAGVPFFANPQTALLFPLTALAYVLPAPVALGLIPILKLATAGLAMYWFLRVIAIGPPAAFIAAAAFMLNASLIAWLQWSNSTPGILLPLVFAVIECVRAAPAPRAVARSVAGLAAVVALQMFAGYPQGAFVGLLAAGAWALCRAHGAPRPGPFLLRCLAGAALGVALGAVQLAPFLEYLRHSAVLADRALWMPTLSLPGRAAIAFLMPHYYGSPTGRDFWGPWNFNEIAVSLGLVPWVVLPLAAVTVARDGRARFFLAMAALSAAVLYGLPGAEAIRSSLPGAALVIGQRFAPLLVFALAALTALGLQILADGAGGRHRLFAAALKGGVVLVLGAALVSIARDYAAWSREPLRVPVPVQYAWLVLLLTAAALLALRRLRAGEASARWWFGLALVEMLSVFPVAASHNPVVEARWLYPVPPAVAHLQRESAADLGRVLVHPNVPMLHGLFEAGGYDGMTPVHVARIVGPAGMLSLSASDGLSNATVFASPALDLLGVRRIAVRPDVALPDDGFALEYSGPDARVYTNRRALPRAWLAPRARCVTDERALDLIWRRAVDFREEVLLADCVDPPGPSARGRAAQAEIRTYAPDRVAVRAVSDAPTYLMLSDTWFPGWRARVNGVDARVWRADHALRAVWLPPGEHDVEFRYEPMSVRLGLVVSLVAGGVTMVLALRTRRAARGALVASAAALCFLSAAVTPGQVEGALPPPPFDFSVTASTVAEGQPVALRIAPRAPAVRDDQRFDLYLVVYVGWDVDSFVGPDGTRSPAPVPYRRGMSARDLAPIADEWRDPIAVESLALAAVSVAVSRSPLSRAHWVYRPTLRPLVVRPRLDGEAARRRAAVALGALAFATLAATLVVLAYPTGAPPPTGGGPSSSP